MGYKQYEVGYKQYQVGYKQYEVGYKHYEVGYKHYEVGYKQYEVGYKQYLTGIIDCGWSGGFHINNAQSDVVAMKGSDGRQIFIQCTVVLQGSSFHVVFADFNDLPSPYR